LASVVSSKRLAGSKLKGGVNALLDYIPPRIRSTRIILLA
jgi:hypothetical protein